MKAVLAPSVLGSTREMRPSAKCHSVTLRHLTARSLWCVISSFWMCLFVWLCYLALIVIILYSAFTLSSPFFPVHGGVAAHLE